MDDLYDDKFILQSIRSEDSEEPVEQKKKTSKIETTIQAEDLIKKQQQFRDTLDFGYSVYEPKPQNVKQNINKVSTGSQSDGSDCDWNSTDQIILYAKNSQKPPDSKVPQRKADNKQLFSPQRPIKYPELDKKSDNVHSNQKRQGANKFVIKNGDIQQNIYVRTSTEQQQISINMSMIGERNKKPSNIKTTKKEDVPVQVPKQNLLKQNQIQPQITHSVYLTKSKKQQVITGVFLKIMDDTMYWIHDNKEIKLNSQVLSSLVQQFFKREIMLPLISDTQFKSEYITVYMYLYTEFLNQFFGEEFKCIFTIIKASLTNGSKFQVGQTPITPKSSAAGMVKNLYNSYMPSFLKSAGYSKSELVCNHMIKKLTMINLMQRIASKKQENLSNLVQQRKKLEQCIAILSLLISFENSEVYCKDNSKQGIDHTIWKQHGRKINQLRRKWVAKLQRQNIDFSFRI